MSAFSLVTDEPTHWVLKEWERTGQRLAWGSMLAAEKARELGYNVVVLCATGAQYPEWSTTRDLEIVRFPFDDDGKLMASDHFTARLCEMARGLASRFHLCALTPPCDAPRVRMLVTCAMGYNRSALVAARVLHEITGYPGFLCVRHVRELRPQALHREAFRDWAETWEARP